MSTPDRYRSASRLVTVVSVLMAARMLYALAAGWFGWSRIQLLTSVQNGEPISLEQARASDSLQILLGFVSIFVSVPLAVVFLMWVYRAAKNARALGATDMTYSPGWSVGWWFVPVMCLFKPYQALKEIWQASHPDYEWEAWRHAPSSPLLLSWWLLWVFSVILGQFALRVSMQAVEVPDVIAASWFELLADVDDIPTGLAALAVVHGLHNMQRRKAARGQFAQGTEP